MVEGEYIYATIEYHFGPDGPSGILEPDWLKIDLHVAEVETSLAWTQLRTPNIYAGEGTLYD